MCKSSGQVSTDQGWRCNSKCYAHTCPCTSGSSPPFPDLLLPGQLHPSSSLGQCPHILALSSPPVSHLQGIRIQSLLSPHSCSSAWSEPPHRCPPKCFLLLPLPPKSRSNPNARSHLVTPAQNPGMTFCLTRVKPKTSKWPRGA